MLVLALALSFFSIPSSIATPTTHEHRDVSTESSPSSLPDTWYQADDHFAHDLFRRDASTTNFPAIGSSGWSAGFPQGKPDAKTIPQAWTDALNAAVSSGKIPNIPVSTSTNGGNPTYGGQDPNKLPICSATYKCRSVDQVWDAPDGQIGISFDDGPLAGSSDDLYGFLQQNNIPSTHFFIGVNILNNWKEFQTAYETLHSDIAVHTWTHPYMTTLLNEDVVAELGYTMQIIYNSTGGRLTRFWRPPYGDTDTRVTAIAKEVFGMTTVIWNQDTEDWSIPTGGTTEAKVAANFQKWLTGSKSPGLMVLEHELATETVACFKAAYPVMQQNNWDIVSVAQMWGNSTYLNALNSSTPILASGNLVSGGDGGNLSSALASASSTSAPASASLSQSASASASSASGSAASGASGSSNNGALRFSGSAAVATVFGIVFGAVLA